MKKLIIFIIMLSLSSIISAHCGSCGGGSSNHDHLNEITSDLTNDQAKAIEKLNKSYTQKYKKLDQKYKNDLSKIVGKNRVNEYEKEYCPRSKKMKTKNYSNKKEKSDS